MQASTLLQKLAMTAMRIFSFTLRIAFVADDLTSCSEPGLAWNTFGFTYPHKKKSSGDKSGDLAGQGKLERLEIIFSLKRCSSQANDAVQLQFIPESN